MPLYTRLALKIFGLHPYFSPLVVLVINLWLNIWLELSQQSAWFETDGITFHPFRMNNKNENKSTPNAHKMETETSQCWLFAFVSDATHQKYDPKLFYVHCLATILYSLAAVAESWPMRWKMFKTRSINMNNQHFFIHKNTQDESQEHEPIKYRGWMHQQTISSIDKVTWRGSALSQSHRPNAFNQCNQHFQRLSKTFKDFQNNCPTLAFKNFQTWNFALSNCGTQALRPCPERCHGGAALRVSFAACWWLLSAEGWMLETVYPHTTMFGREITDAWVVPVFAKSLGIFQLRYTETLSMPPKNWCFTEEQGNSLPTFLKRSFESAPYLLCLSGLVRVVVTPNQQPKPW